MKMALIFFLSSLVIVASPTNNIIIPVLNIGNDCYTNAHILRANPAYAVIDTGVGVLKVSMSNMPPFIQQKYDYSPTNALKFLGQEKQKIAAQKAAQITRSLAEQKEMEAKAKKAGWIYIVDVPNQIRRSDGLRKYTAQLGGRTFQIYLSNPPAGLDAAVKQFVMERAQDEGDYVLASMKRDRTGQWLARENAMKDYRYLIPRVRAFDTGKLCNGIPVWQFVAKND